MEATTYEEIKAKFTNTGLEIEESIIDSAEALEIFRIKYLGSKSIIKDLAQYIKEVPGDHRKEAGMLLNHLKTAAENRYQSLQATFVIKSGSKKSNIDLSAPGYPMELGARHPVSIVMNQIIDIFKRIGFTIAEDREIEDDWHNFTALNTPDDHPARDMQDTFYIKDSIQYLLRTHTSPVQARVMTRDKPPIRIIAPGRVYRNETVSARSHCQFHQVEGLYIDEGVSFADMKQTLLYYAREQYGSDVKIRLRPSFSPFTEPSAEMDVYYGLADETAHKITKGTGWLEILGCGMVDPTVLENCGIDSTKYSGFAFGMGIERQVLLKYGVPDIRMLFENDVRFLKQFTGL
ncbi:MAG: phenylalanine--tRNA ligase subunit alpha [Saprospiraceae bacterium]|nr:phenylalanine--tRNA ligase subunit alpha [Saprospiraceae bacterium]